MASKASHEGPAEDPALGVAARHALHDEEVVAAFASGGADDEEAVRARSLIARCTTCAALATDIAAISQAVRALPDGVRLQATIRAPRDFRISPEQAARLRPASPPARIAAALFGGALGVARPLGATLATFGLVGLLVGTVSLAPGGSAGSVPALGPAATAESAPGFGAAGGQPGASDDKTRNDLQPLSTSTAEQVAGPTDTTADATGTTGAWWLLAGSGLLLLAGLALLYAGFRGADGRRREDEAGT